ncbi:MAG TPA: cellulose synthase family protein [Vicinamibacteria bacterium]|nr:cellulose synthase family protein [Vicinamibacteria bacterium]
MESLVLTAYFAVLMTLAIFGGHRYLMVYLYYRYRANRLTPAGRFAKLPKVTVQLPVFNELYVVERLIDSVCVLDYPRELLEIQVLDDSTDETAELARRRVAHHRERGVDIHHLHRSDRTGFKAGALKAGLEVARGELIAIFDADFVPPPDFLRQTVDFFVDTEVGMVQARWGHINHEYSLLTRAQTILLDAHFVLEHGGRNRSGCFFNFNGTAGIWRRRAIEDAGGWQHDTLTEDLDLSYRAQLRGWRFVFVPDVVTPAEIPVSMSAFKSQQHRWSKGSFQTAKKLLPRLLASPLPLRIKVESVFHLTANLAYPLMVLLSLLVFPSMLIRYDMGWHEMFLVDVPFFLAATVSVTGFYVVSQREIHDDWKARIKVLPMLLSLGIGMSVNNARAVLEALFGRTSGFVRTPKYRIESRNDGWKRKKYGGTRSFLPLVEVALGLYFTVAVAYAASHQIVGSLPFLVLFQVGFLYTGVLSLRESGLFAPRRTRSREGAPVTGSWMPSAGS